MLSATGRPAEACVIAEAALAKAQASKQMVWAPAVQRAWGQALAALTATGQPAADGDSSDGHFAESLRLSAESGACLEAARTHLAWGQVLLARGDTIAGREHVQQAAAQFAASGMERELAQTRQLLDALTARG